MLWLTGLLGVVVVGAVAFLDLSGSNNAAEDEDEPVEEPVDQSRLAGFRDTLAGLNVLPEAASANRLEDDAKRAYQALMQNVDEPREDWHENASHAGDPTLESPDSEEEEDGVLTIPGPVTDLDWISASSPADVAGVNAQTDDLVLVWDDSIGEEPDVTLSHNPDIPSLLDIRIDDEIVAQVPADSGVTADHIVLVPMSAAQGLGWVES